MRRFSLDLVYTEGVISSLRYAHCRIPPLGSRRRASAARRPGATLWTFGPPRVPAGSSGEVFAEVDHPRHDLRTAMPVRLGFGFLSSHLLRGVCHAHEADP
jgi:hypothetical protein